LNFNFIRDIAPVASISREPLVMLVHPSFPAKTVPEFIAYAKARTDRGRYVESRMGAVAWGRVASLRFPSPLIKPDGRVWRVRLSGGLHREAHGGGTTSARRSCSTPSVPKTAASPNFL